MTDHDDMPDDPAPGMTGIDLPLEPIPGGPVDVPVPGDTPICAGLTYRPGSIEFYDRDRPDVVTDVPAIVFDFYTVHGVKLQPIVLVDHDGSLNRLASDLAACRRMARDAAKAATKRRHEGGRS